jgi:transcriptional regulator with XRE-family HTH domain
MMTAIDFNPTFCARVRAIREAHKKTQSEMARILGVTEKAYEKYESRSPLPHYLIDRFAQAMGVDIDELFMPPKAYANGNCTAPLQSVANRNRE